MAFTVYNLVSLFLDPLKVDPEAEKPLVRTRPKKEKTKPTPENTTPSSTEGVNFTPSIRERWN